MPAIQIVERMWTPEEFYDFRDARQDGCRYELVDGELLVTASPVRRHQRIVARLWWQLDAHVQRRGLGEALMAPFDVKLERAVILQPDILLIAPNDPGEREVNFVSLAVEVLSPSSTRHDRVTKRLRYQKSRIPEYWIVDHDTRAVERWRPDDDRPEILIDRLVWHPAGTSDPLELDLVQFFREMELPAGRVPPLGERLEG